MWKVVDVNYLNDPRLWTFLKQRKSNKVVLNEYAMIESYKGNAISNIDHSTRFIRDFPNQVVVLKCIRPLVSISPDTRGLRSRLVDKQSTRGLLEFCQNVELALAGNRSFRAQIEEHKQEALKRLETMRQSALAVKDYVRNIRRFFGTQDLKEYRVNRQMTSNFGKMFVDQVLILFATLHRDHPDTAGVPEGATVPNRYLFRISVAYCLLALRWAALGGSEDVHEDRLLNDVVDMHYVTAATYFDGLLTRDKKMKEIYSEARFCLDDIFVLEPK